MSTPKLFTESPDFLANAYVGPSGLLTNDAAHAHAWKAAADIVADHALARSRGRLDYFFPVICYLYRHYVELELKLVIRLAAHFDGKPNPDLTRDHNIGSLLDQLNALLSAYPDLRGAFDGEIGTLLRELHDRDPDGQRFRYLTRRDGSAAIPDLAVDVEKLKARMDEIADCFVGVESVLDEMLQAGY